MGRKFSRSVIVKRKPKKKQVEPSILSVEVAEWKKRVVAAADDDGHRDPHRRVGKSARNR